MSTNYQTPVHEGESAPQKVGADTFRLGYRRSLDGLRGVAILMVVLSHTCVLSASFAFMGVQIFFVLSGFLITSLLAEEWNQTGTISLRAFYLRRALRLLPCLYVMLVAFLIFGALFHSPADLLQDWKEARATFFYYANWVQASESWLMIDLGHTWSLSIEEQFYIVWPVILLFLLRRYPRKTILNLTILGVFLICFARFLVIEGSVASVMRLNRGSDTRADALLLGSAIGLWLTSGPLPSWHWIRAGLRAGSLISVVGLAYMLYVCNPYALEEYTVLIGWFLMCVFAGLIILEQMIAPGLLLQFVLGNWFLVYVGKISYGLYVWHYPILKAFYHNGGIPPWPKRVLIIVLSGLIAIVSYYVIERPFLRIKKRFKRAD